MQQQQLTHNVMTIVQSLPLHLQKEVGHYAEYIRLRHLQKKDTPNNDWAKDEALIASLPAIWKDWDSDADAIYDNL